MGAVVKAQAARVSEPLASETRGHASPSYRVPSNWFAIMLAGRDLREGIDTGNRRIKESPGAAGAFRS